MFASQFNKFLVFFKFAIANGAKILLILNLVFICSIISNSFQIFDLIFGQTYISRSLSGSHQLKKSKKVCEWWCSSLAFPTSLSKKLFRGNNLSDKVSLTIISLDDHHTVSSSKSWILPWHSFMMPLLLSVSSGSPHKPKKISEVSKRVIILLILIIHLVLREEVSMLMMVMLVFISSLGWADYHMFVH